jgi:hypothetical protein
LRWRARGAPPIRKTFWRTCVGRRRTGLALILDDGDGGDEVLTADGGDGLGHELYEAAAQGAHDHLGVDDPAAFEVALVFAVLGEERVERKAGSKTSRRCHSMSTAPVAIRLARRAVGSFARKGEEVLTQM